MAGKNKNNKANKNLIEVSNTHLFFKFFDIFITLLKKRY
jgi:hypothetical protein